MVRMSKRAKNVNGIPTADFVDREEIVLHRATTMDDGCAGFVCRGYSLGTRQRRTHQILGDGRKLQYIAHLRFDDLEPGREVETSPKTEAIWYS